VLQCVAVCYSALQSGFAIGGRLTCCVETCCSVLQCVAVCCSRGSPMASACPVDKSCHTHRYNENYACI